MSLSACSACSSSLEKQGLANKVVKAYADLSGISRSFLDLDNAVVGLGYIKGLSQSDIIKLASNY